MHHFFAYMARLRNITRCGLMRNNFPENNQDHALQAATLAHVLATNANVPHSGTYDADKIAAVAMYHDAGEVITGDLATPIKHFNPEVREAFDALEEMARGKLLCMLPEDLRASYAPYLLADESDNAWHIVKAADRICAYLKCVEEMKAGNMEFAKAKAAILQDIEGMERPEVADFMREFAPSFELSLDELN